MYPVIPLRDHEFIHVINRGKRTHVHVGKKGFMEKVEVDDSIINNAFTFLLQFFLENECFSEQLTEEQMDVLKRWNKLTKEQQKKLADFLDSLL